MVQQPVGKSKKHLWLWIAVVVAVLLLAFGAGAGLRWWKENHKPPTPRAVVDTSQNLAIGGDLQKAQSQIDESLNRDDLTNDERYLLEYQKGTNYQNNGKHKEALESFNRAVTFKETQSLYTSMGEAAQALKQNKQAIEYFKKAITLIPSSNPVAAEDKASLEQHITSLEQQP